MTTPQTLLLLAFARLNTLLGFRTKASKAQPPAKSHLMKGVIVDIAEKTISLRPSTFMAAISDWISSLSRHGFERIYFLNGHGGNVASIEAAFAEVWAEWSWAETPPPMTLKLRNWWDLPGVTALCNGLFPTGHGMHATPSEIAVTQAAYPDRIKTAAYSPQIAPVGPIRDALDYRARFPDGRIGSDPAQASPQKGRQIIDLAAPALLEDVRAFAGEALPTD